MHQNKECMQIEEQLKVIESDGFTSYTESHALKPLEKAALLLTSFDQQYALKIIHKLQKDEIREVFKWLDQDTFDSQEEVDQVVADFYEFLLKRK